MKHDELKQQIPDRERERKQFVLDAIAALRTRVPRPFSDSIADMNLGSLLSYSGVAAEYALEGIAELEAKLAQARKEALEEAERVCHTNAFNCMNRSNPAGLCHHADAADIRALIAKETP